MIVPTRSARTAPCRIAAVLALLVASASPSRADDKPWRIHGLVFGDYYWFAEHHDPGWQDQQGFWLRRVYLGYDHSFGDFLSMRLRLEMNSDGQLEGGNLEPYVKDAWLTWTYAGKHQVRLGIQPSMTFDAEEQLWGLRHVEKTPADLYRIDSSRDLGVTLQGPAPLKGLGYAVQLGNESGTGSETDEYKVVRLFAVFDRSPGLHAEALFNEAHRPGGLNRRTVKLLAGWRGAAFRAGGEYLWQRRQSGDAALPDTEIRIWSFFGAYDVLPKKATLFARWDDAAARQAGGAYELGVPGASGIDYLPINDEAPFRVLILGFEWSLHPSVRVGPNVEWVSYRTPPGTTPIGDDLVPRVTFYWSF